MPSKQSEISNIVRFAHYKLCLSQGFDNAQRFKFKQPSTSQKNIEVPSSIQATNSVPGSFVLLCRPCAASMISKSSSSWKFEMWKNQPAEHLGTKIHQEWYMIYEKLYAYHVWNMYIHIYIRYSTLNIYKLYDSKNDCKPLTNHWKLKCMYRKRRTEVTLIEFYFCALNISK